MATKGISIEERLTQLEKRLVGASGKYKQKLLKRKATLLVLSEKESPEPVVKEIIPPKLLAEDLVSVLPVEEPVVEPVVEEEPVVEPVVEEVKEKKYVKKIWRLGE